MPRILLISMAILWIVMVPLASAAPCDTGWTFYKPITIVNNNATKVLLANYSVKITLDTTGANFLDNGTDVRMRYNGHDIHYINTTQFNQTSTQIWFMVQANITAGATDSSNYAVCYGNPGASLFVSYWNNTFIGGDGYFNNANEWTVVDGSSGTLAITGGQIVFTNLATDGTGSYVYYDTNGLLTMPVGDFIIESVRQITAYTQECFSNIGFSAITGDMSDLDASSYAQNYGYNLQQSSVRVVTAGAGTSTFGSSSFGKTYQYFYRYFRIGQYNNVSGFYNPNMTFVESTAYTATETYKDFRYLQPFYNYDQDQAARIATGWVDNVTARRYMLPEPTATPGVETPTAGGGVVVTLTVAANPVIVYNLTDVNFSVFYNHSGLNFANITINVTVNRHNITDYNPVTYTNVQPNTTLYAFVAAIYQKKHDNITVVVNLTTNSSTTDDENLTVEVNNTQPSAPSISWSVHSIVVGDGFNATGSATDADNDALTYWYIYGWSNSSNFTTSVSSLLLTANATDENHTFRVYAAATDGEANGTFSSSSMVTARIVITGPLYGATYYAKDLYHSFNFTVNSFLGCTETVDNSTYALGNISASQNHTRTVWYGNHTYNVSCQSLANSGRYYSKAVNYRVIYATWNVSIYTENAWDTPLNITSANLSIIVRCAGGASYVYNFTGTIITGVEPLCDVETVSAKIDYSTDSYLRERIPPCSGICEVRMYMADALIYTILQIPIYMSDYNYYSSLVELYKLSNGNHYTIAEGFFDVEHKYVTYLMKDNTYLIRITKNGVVRDIGYLYAATATAQYLSLSSITLRPTITLISDNLLMAADFLTPAAPTSTLRISYADLMNLTTDVRIQVFQASNNTAFFDSTYTGISNFSISLVNINTSFRYSVHFIVNHVVLGNSPIPFTIGVGSFGRNFDLGLNPAYAWFYNAFAFFVILLTSWIILPENRLPGFVVLLAETGIFSVVQWIAFQSAQLMLFVVFLVAGMLFEIRHRGVT